MSDSRDAVTRHPRPSGAQPDEIRNWPGVTPSRRLNTLVRWLWSEKPVRAATGVEPVIGTVLSPGNEAAAQAAPPL